jgi:Ser/Thr protein kinase RdoA (MazF antagonist)
MSARVRRPDGSTAVGPLPVRPEMDRFAEALRPRLMGPRLADAVGGADGSCHVLDAKYEPGVRATVLYECAGRLLRGDLLPLPDLETSPVGAAGGTVVAPGMRVSGFPHDPELPFLPELVDPARLGPVLAEAVGAPHRGARCRTTLLRYRPGKRATLRVTFVGRPGGYVAKAYHDPAKAAAVAGEAPALSGHAQGCATLRIPPTVAHLRERGLVVQQCVPGLPLEALLGRSLSTAGGVRVATEAMSRAGRALAELHDMPPASSRRRSVDAELDRFGRRAAGIAVVDPRLGAALAGLAERLRDAQARLPAPVAGTVHGDCKPSQFLLDGPHAVLLDLDHVGVSDQAGDAGTFLASLRQLSLRSVARTSDRSARSGALSALATAFLRSYLEARADDATLPRIRWQEAVALERKALRAWARAPGSPMAGRLVREANTCLDRLTETP